MQHTSELLMPAGSLEKLKTAILYGADAVYAGTPDLSLRTKSAFSLEELQEGINFAHMRGKKVYLTLNLFSHNKDMERLPSFIDTIKKVNPDGVIIADPGIFQYVKEHAPNLELHISTQANVCSSLTVDFWKKQGASLVVLAREVSFDELSQIRRDHDDIKLEVFVHGSMCMTYSGRCLLSNFMAERGANQGNCAQSCRWNYEVKIRLKDGTISDIPLNDQTRELFDFLLEEEFRPGELMPIVEDERGAYILNARDLCLMPHLADYLALGVDSLKIEGRHKTEYYAAVVARAYRAAIDAWRKDPEHFDPAPFMAELDTVQNRGYTKAFHDGRLTNLAHNYDHAASVASYEYAGHIVAWEEDSFLFQAKNTISGGELLQFLSPNFLEPIRVRLATFEDAETGETFEKVHAGQQRTYRIPAAIFEQFEGQNIRDILPTYTVARKKKKLTLQEQARLLLDIETRKAELEQRLPDPAKRERALELLRSEEDTVRRMKVAKPGPKMGSEGCCGKGCNGCMIFWHDDKYKEARALMREKKIGEKLTSRGGV
ncbi:peptidase U32 [Candidatus Gracilibacteria bacterium CG17_big_fil_post_rev_8_21_14_2_50_48_13]|nr:MAG: peptidase U32 [Candidatus Gracilibacteria bacterium CG17_big_fil_post_rev_8_21_14_2_50_48_13]